MGMRRKKRRGGRGKGERLSQYEPASQLNTRASPAGHAAIVGVVTRCSVSVPSKIEPPLG
jgi:hypothetical protein